MLAPAIAVKIATKITTTIKKQKYDLAKLRRLMFFVPPNENIRSIMKPTHGMENRISYPKYPHIEMGV
jgi:hypothetical protein